MVIVKVTAGLCNQIYFFATAYALAKEWDEELVIDLDVDGNAEWTYLLDEFNMPSYKKMIYPLRYNIGKEFVKVIPEIREKSAIIEETYFEEDEGYLTIPREKFRSEFPEKDIYLKGTFLMRQMFTKYISDLRKIFTLKETSRFVREFEGRIKHITAVGVHIRRQAFTVLGDDNGMDFFMAAIVYMRQQYSDARFYIFSDDLKYVKENLGTADDIFYMDAMNGYRGDVEEFVCLTKCHHYILTRRSTYGRMAEILNSRPGTTSVLYGGNTWNDSEERFHFLPQEEVRRLSKLYEKRKIINDVNLEEMFRESNRKMEEIFADISLNSESVTDTDRRQIIFQKAREYANQGNYGQAAHLCWQLEEFFGENAENFHEFYGDLLYKYGKMREALVEYACVAQKNKMKEIILQKEGFISYQELLGEEKKKHYIIVQYDHFASQYRSELQMIGLILARMGEKVSFIFKRATTEIPEDIPNSKMMRWESNIDNKYMDLILEKGYTSGRFYFGYPCYEYENILKNKIDNLRMIADKYPDKESVILGRNPQILSADVPFQKVFVDFSEPFDEAYLKSEVGDENISAMYECADIVVTRGNEYSREGQQIVRVDDSLLDIPQLGVEKDVPCFEPTLYTEDYLDIALKIAAQCQS